MKERISDSSGRTASRADPKFYFRYPTAVTCCLYSQSVCVCVCVCVCV